MNATQNSIRAKALYDKHDIEEENESEDGN